MKARWSVFAFVLAVSGTGLILWLGENRPANSPSRVMPDAVPAAPTTVERTDNGLGAPDVRPREEPLVVTAMPSSFPAWDDLYRSSTDYFSFVQAAAPAAIAGDGEAQWLLSKALMECQLEGVTAQEVRAGRLPGHLATTPRAQRCQRFRDADPLESFDLPEDASSFAYWRNQALASQNPNAVMLRAAKVASGLHSDTSAATKAELHRQVLEDLRIVVESQEPEAILTLTSLYMNPNVARDDLQWVSWAVAACDLGYDCTQPMPAARDECAASGLCSAVTTVGDMIQRHPKLASNGAEIYAAAQDIAQHVRAQNWDSLEAHLKLRP
jgi:hypothetical protein